MFIAQFVSAVWNGLPLGIRLSSTVATPSYFTTNNNSYYYYVCGDVVLESNGVLETGSSPYF